MPDADITKLKKEYEEKLAKLKALMKNPQVDTGLFNNNFGFTDKNLHFGNSGGTRTSSVDKIENYYAIGYPYKRGVKLEFAPDGGAELGVAAGGGDDLYGICTDIDEFTSIATVIPITNSYEGYLVLKDTDQGNIALGDKLYFDEHGMLAKTGVAKKTVNAIALSKAHKLNESLYIVHTLVFGNRAVPK
ncbi:hypothetical protein CR532_05205 (plasmid) [Candidatus Borreliella tachyglossi]|uniref:Uncharacterized protein n=1 Tax=Candidatus Borreliella tachyglossi TaxID=1964448 RepID=A0A2S1LYS1_9SPIR|nr:DUF228 domain-containing protein [Candidatus Borreliella tachyglossi]AWG43362.1 hypothetical protein CR532_05025 [Candidatus Borreliella tachyglossi]AWG43395.1 hypothetical protein CR532_05205 [Candidatus Borreliella tachyglossi]